MCVSSKYECNLLDAIRPHQKNSNDYASYAKHVLYHAFTNDDILLKTGSTFA